MHFGMLSKNDWKDKRFESLKGYMKEFDKVKQFLGDMQIARYKRALANKKEKDEATRDAQ